MFRTCKFGSFVICPVVANNASSDRQYGHSGLSLRLSVPFVSVMNDTKSSVEKLGGS